MYQKIFTFLILPPILFAQNGNLTNINQNSDFLVYYGNWNKELISKAEPFDVVILDPSNLTPQMVTDIRDGADDIIGTDDDVLVLCYISIGEVSSGNIIGNGIGPSQFRDGKVIYDSAGYASWYVDDADNNNVPDQNGIWGSFYVNAGDTSWWQYIRTMPHGTDYIMNVLKCDGLFFDTIDTASPWTPYYWTAKGMSKLIATIRSWYPNAILMANRGLFYFDPSLQAYQYNIRPYINAVLFEDYYTEWNWNKNIGELSPYFQNNKKYWAPIINNEARKPDGFTVFALDYLNPQQNNYQTMLQNQIYEVIDLQGWVDAISSINLDEIRYDVYHQHNPDINYPTWPKHEGIGNVLVNGQDVLLQWDAAFDQTLPINYNIYYTTNLPFNFSNASKLSHVQFKTSSSNFDNEFLITNLEPATLYYFAVRAEDSSNPPNEDKNNFYLSSITAEDPSTIQIKIDGEFLDWKAVPKLDFPPNPFEEIGDGPTIDTDIVDVWSWSDSANIYFRYRVQRYVSLTGNFYRILLDTDDDSTTGFRWKGSSAGFDFMIENKNLFKYTGENNLWSWQDLGTIETGLAPSQIEIRVSYLQLNLNPSNFQVKFIFQSDNGNNTGEDIAPNDYQSHPYSLKSQITSIQSKVNQNRFNFKDDFILIYPNPFNSVLNLRIFSYKFYEKFNLSLFNLLGQKVATFHLGSLNEGLNQFQVNFSDFPQISTGIYIISSRLGNIEIKEKILYLK